MTRRFSAPVAALLRLACLAGTGLLAAPLAYAQLPAPLAVPLPDGPVTGITVEQEGRRLVDPVILDLVETPVGRPLAMRDVRETISHLMSLGRFEDVQVYADPAGAVRVVLVPLHPVDRIELRGALVLRPDDVMRELVDRVGRTPSAGRIPDVQRVLQAYYRGRGFVGAQVAAHVEETHDPDRASMVVEIQAGRRLPIGRIDVEGASPADRAALLDEARLRVGEPYDADAIGRGLGRYEARLRADGYYQARATHTNRVQPDDTAAVTVTLERGPKVSVVFAGDELPAADRSRLVPVLAEASVEQDLLEDSTRAIEDYLHARGYRDARAEYARREAPGTLAITFTVTRGRRSLVDGVTITGNASVPTADLLAVLPLRPDAVFVQETLDTGVAAIRNSYRSRGYTRPTVRGEVTGVADEAGGDRRVAVALTIVEGPRTTIGDVRLVGNAVVGEAALRPLLTGIPGRPFSEAEVAGDRDTLELEYRNRGYDAAVVTPTVTLAAGDTRADVTYTITEGPQAIVDHVIVIGNRRTRTSTIERELTLKPGDPLGFAALLESQQRLGALGLFRRIQVSSVTHPGEARRDVLVQVEEAPPTTVGYGGGLEGGTRLRPASDSGQAEERLEVAPRGFFEIGRRNLWGKNRAVNLFGRASLRARDIGVSGTTVPSSTTGTTAGTVEGTNYGFNEYRVYATYREPKVFGLPADLLVTGILDQAIRSSFNFITREVRAEAGFRLSPRYSLAGRYSFERTRLFDEHITAAEKPLIDRLFPQVRLSKGSASFIRDTRDDVLYPNRGTFTVADGELAARSIGSEVGFVKTFVQGFAYLPLPAKRRTILALGARLGAAHGFPREVTSLDETTGAVVREMVQDLPASERFFAGGDTTVRGFSLDRLGGASTISPTGFPTGGNGEIVLNAELRVGVLKQRAELVGFLDAGNIYQRVSDMDLTDLRSAAGFGFRYRSPVGPIRVDVGFNLDRRELVPGQLERPYVLHVSLGQAF